MKSIHTMFTESQSTTANPLAWPDSEKERKITVTSGRKLSELYAKSDPLGLLARMLLESSRWYSPARRLRWEAKPMRDRVWFVAYCTDRWNIIPSEREESSLHERESIAKSYTNRPSSYTDGNRHSSRESSKENERRREDISSTTRKGGSGSKRSNGLFGFSQYATNSNNNRLQGDIFSRNNEKERRKVKDRYVKESSYNSWLSIPADRWKDFPTQSPVLSGDDELSTRLDGITFSKWRQESIKAYGNAWVPAVAYEIFKAIEEVTINYKYNDRQLKDEHLH